ncbi:MAG: beta-phosphoglucomutase family hydrolase [[Actinobacillus] rossii]|uniref:Beta-phosphoglucomutase family hydrolase n=1 Tax=[Actinobacillus] rossii TaxID=123820 RepID=A0A380TN85_9PAST|nr:beta-phosphoglucomutase family hydrolase [[Actinobacillus] rossii]MDD7426494.1 beta-phosphoglucomutase family hydrolase [[Actinobacillus] rossii]MDD7570174.1 beta-phosphoglucomutase family hydrolase [[Actinobacillus] rossii]MDY3124862.1 beta-phosphoglucomutase family hydrolase [[Actinobacillus] rossii]MDY4506537.1 beta-phosphoglucomutase family hydrolase [[Actinobacillus] rossii]
MLEQSIINQYDALIFDMDGTLIDTMPSHAKAWEKVGEHLGYPVKGDVMYEFGGATVRTIATETCHRYGIPLELLEEVIRLKRQYGFEMVMENATLLPTFDIVKNNYGKRSMALGTGSHSNMVNMLLDKFDLRQYFNAVVDADMVTTHKPNPETFLQCAERLGVLPNQCLVFEDADLGVQAALNGGMDVFDVRTNTLTRAY